MSIDLIPLIQNSLNSTREDAESSFLPTPRRFRYRLGFLVLALSSAFAAGCTSEDPADSNSGVGAGGGAALGADAGSDAATTAVDFIALQQGAPETAYWDDPHNLLYIVDNTGNKIWKWSDSGGLSAFASLPLPKGETSLPGNVTLGQAALLGDGTLVVNRFGQPGGGFGDIAFARADGTSDVVPNMDATRRRLGLALAPNGTLYGSYFVSGTNNQIVGSLTTVDIHSGETVVADGFGKIVGLAIGEGRLYLSDQSSGKILDAPLAAIPARAADWHVLATLVKPDQICVGPNGSLFTGQFQGAPGSSDPIAIRQITADGTVTAFKQDPEVSKPSGVAYDPSHHRLFAADSGNSSHVGVHVFQVP